MDTNKHPQPNPQSASQRRPDIPQKPMGRTKKEQILACYDQGMKDIKDIAESVGSTSSYVASVLQNHGRLRGYFDLYTRTGALMNVYSRELAGRLGFKTVARARASVELLDRFYTDAGNDRDRAAQHHALTAALLMFDRARWSGKAKEAGVFRDWIIRKLGENGVTAPGPSAN